MPQLTFFEKIEVLFGNIMDYPIFLILFSVPIIAYLIHKKLLKKGAVIIYLIASILVLLINYKLVPNLFDSLVEEMIDILIFPSMGLIFAVVIAELIILILTILKNYRKVIKIINSISFVIIEIMFGIVLTLIVQNKIDFSKNQVLYNYLDVVTLMQLIMCTFGVQLSLLLISKCIDKITLKLDGHPEEIINEKETLIEDVIVKNFILDKEKSKNIFTEKTNVFETLPIIKFNVDREKSITLKGKKIKTYNLNKEKSKSITSKYILKLFNLNKEKSLMINTKKEENSLDVFNQAIPKEEIIFEENIVIPDVEEDTTLEEKVNLPVFEENIIIPDIEEEVIETEELPKLEAVTIEEKNESDIVEPLEEQVESDITEVKEEPIEFNNDILINEIKKAVSHKKTIPSPFIEGSIIPKVNEEKQKDVVSEVKKQESIKEVIPKEENKLDVISKPEVKSISRSDVAKIAQKVNSIEINSSKFINENTRKQMEEELLLYKEQLLKYKEEQLKKQENLRKQMEEFSSIFNITKDDLKY